jgi:hypothetical protein
MAKKVKTAPAPSKLSKAKAIAKLYGSTIGLAIVVGLLIAHLSNARATKARQEGCEKGTAAAVEVVSGGQLQADEEKIKVFCEKLLKE